MPLLDRLVSSEVDGDCRRLVEGTTSERHGCDIGIGCPDIPYREHTLRANRLQFLPNPDRKGQSFRIPAEKVDVPIVPARIFQIWNYASSSERQLTSAFIPVDHCPSTFSTSRHTSTFPSV